MTPIQQLFSTPHLLRLQRPGYHRSIGEVDLAMKLKEETVALARLSENLQMEDSQSCSRESNSQLADMKLWQML